MDLFKQKYLKYKSKYLQLKSRQFGGSNIDCYKIDNNFYCGTSTTRQNIEDGVSQCQDTVMSKIDENYNIYVAVPHNNKYTVTPVKQPGKLKGDLSIYSCDNNPQTAISLSKITLKETEKAAINENITNSELLKKVNKNKENQVIVFPENLIFEKNGYAFKIVGKTEPKNINDRVFIHIKTLKNMINPDEIDIYFYRSNSELGVCRLTIYNNLHRFEKGYDYVTSTSVDIDMQIFLNNKWKNIKVIDHENTRKAAKNLSVSQKNEIMNIIGIKGIETSFGSHNEKVKGDDRIIDDPIFDTFRSCLTPECFWGKVIYQKRQVPVDPTTLLVGKLGAKNSKYANELKTLINSKKPEQMSNNRCFEFIQAFYDSISELLGKYFEIVSTDKNILGEYVHSVRKAMFMLKFYRITVKNTVNNNMYSLVYATYNFSIDVNKDPQGPYYYIINIVPKTTVNKYCVPKQIVSAGAYIYKPIEYNVQLCTEDTSKLELNKRSIYPVQVEGAEEVTLYEKNMLRYIFIGDFMTNVWPLNQIKT